MAKEIELPTKSKQDDIYNDTQYIKNEFPIEGGGIKSVQRGENVLHDKTIHVSISKVDLDKSMLIVQPYSYYGSRPTGKPSEEVIGKLEADDEITFMCATSGSQNTVLWQVIEFK